MLMTIFEEAYVWIWLPKETNPIVAGLLTAQGHILTFTYGKSYLNKVTNKAISIYEPELPLKRGVQSPLTGLSIPGCIRDGAPDAWGRRVIVNKLTGTKGDDINVGQPNELTYLLESGSDRIGALDFQKSPKKYLARKAQTASLEELAEATSLVEQGITLSPELAKVLQHGSSIGGARPKAQIEEENKKYIAKFSSSSDIYNVIKAEFIAMRLASLCGLQVAKVSLTKSLNKDVLLVERFDRQKVKQGWYRKAMVSALTILELDEMMARYASYQDLAEKIRHNFIKPRDSLKELFGRMVFNVLCGNTDDHARNHAAFWDGKNLSLTPAYDICPQNRTGREANQAMLIFGEVKASKISVCKNAASDYLLKSTEAQEIIDHQIETIESNWTNICEEAEISEVDRNLFWKRQFLNPYSLD